MLREYSLDRFQNLNFETSEELCSVIEYFFDTFCEDYSKHSAKKVRSIIEKTYIFNSSNNNTFMKLYMPKINFNIKFYINLEDFIDYANENLFYNKKYCICTDFDKEPSNNIYIKRILNPVSLCLNSSSNNNNYVPISNPNNIISTNEMDSFVHDTLLTLKNSVAMTLGPYAKTTIVEDRMKRHSITKDGYTVLRSLCFEDDISRTIFEIVLKVSKTLVRKVGDGSTSSIVIAYYLYEKIKPLITSNKISSKDIFDIMSWFSSYIKKEILKVNATPVSDDMHELMDIASISCNNDKHYGNLIMNIYKEIGRYGFINLEKSATDETYYELKNGFEIPRGYISELMANQSDKTSVILEEPKVLMIDGMITENELSKIADFLGSYCAQIGASVVIIASGYSNEAQTFFHINRLNAIRQNNDKLFSVVAIDIATKDKDNRDKFEDLAINLGCKPIRLSNGDSLKEYDAQLMLTKCGSCKQFKGDELNGKFIDGQGDEEIKQERIDDILGELEELSKNEFLMLQDEKIYTLRKRMALLQNSMATLFVGGSSEQEKDTDRFLLEDAVSACKSALKYGYVFGGNLIVPFILDNKIFAEELLSDVSDHFKHIEKKYIEEIMNIIKNAFCESFKSVLRNFDSDEKKVNEIMDNCFNKSSIYNLKTLTYESVNSTSIINSAQTDIEIMNTAISIIGLVATSNQFISLNIRSNK